MVSLTLDELLRKEPLQRLPNAEVERARVVQPGQHCEGIDLLGANHELANALVLEEAVELTEEPVSIHSRQPRQVPNAVLARAAVALSTS
eukprot:8144592-Alexandrium_andersonii.AAC.1